MGIHKITSVRDRVADVIREGVGWLKRSLPGDGPRVVRVTAHITLRAADGEVCTAWQAPPLLVERLTVDAAGMIRTEG